MQSCLALNSREVMADDGRVLKMVVDYAQSRDADIEKPTNYLLIKDFPLDGYVHMLQYVISSWNASNIRTLLQEYGDIEKLDVPVDRNTSRIRGMAFVKYA